MLFAIEDKNSLANLVPKVWAAPGNKETLSLLQGVLTKNLDQAVRFVCLAGLGEKVLKQEESPRGKVSLIYLATRAMSDEGKRPNKKESEKVWSDIWLFASQIPTIASAMEEQAELGNLKSWQSEVQVYALRRWRTLRDEQIPRVKDQIKDLEKRVFDFLNLAPGPVKPE